jgi:glycosyltransferase involved in cell wall biosynthesis
VSERRAPRLISVVVPVRDQAEFLAVQLRALAAQDYDGEWEVVVADNGSSDGSGDVARGFEGKLPGLQVVAAGDARGASHARNRGAAAARGDLLAFCDADNAARPGWVAGMARAAPAADVLAGRLLVDAINAPDAAALFGTLPVDRPLIALEFLPFASGGNCAYWADVFGALGGFDQGLPTAEDVDLSWRAQLAGFELGFAPDAQMDRRCRDRLGAMARQHYHWGRGAAHLIRRYRDAGLSYRSPSEDARALSSLLAAVPGSLRTRAGRGRLVARAASGLGRAVELARR